MGEKVRAVTIYSLGHFLVDFACAFAMFRHAAGLPGWPTAVLVYNFLAFAGQMPVGLLADLWGNGRIFAGAGCFLAAAAFLLPGEPLLLAVTAGLGNALYHIGGGYDILSFSGKKAGLLGVFVSPGALGLFLGTVLGRGSFSAAVPPILLLACGAAILLLCGGMRPGAVAFDLTGTGVAALAALFLVVCVRSYAGFLFAFPWKKGLWSWAFVLCVVLGKTAGGFLYDRWGGRSASLASLGLAAALFCVSGNPVAGCLAVLLFNMSMPVTLRAAADLLPGAKGFSFGLLTFALFLGFLPAYLAIPGVSAGWMYAVLSLLSAALLAAALGRRRS
ncbi:MAG: hypothetical protein IKD79_05350 [Oscillospiraceae bacterium]|nr:hypothetical protein [Oscillospiraceae bacterium]